MHEDRPSLPPELRQAVERAAAELFVGRERELAQLDAALRDAIGGRGRLCLIAGEPGIGKTRLAECVAASAAGHGANAVWGRCWEGEGAPAFWPWVQVFRTYAREIDAQDLHRALGPGWEAVCVIVPELRGETTLRAAGTALDS